MLTISQVQHTLAVWKTCEYAAHGRTTTGTASVSHHAVRDAFLEAGSRATSRHVLWEEIIRGQRNGWTSFGRRRAASLSAATSAAGREISLKCSILCKFKEYGRFLRIFELMFIKTT